jgi:pimeloyl-ACP methyl ester carboxylesterase
MDVIEVDGLRIAFERAGAGPPLILLHGYVGDGPATWRRQIEALCGEFTVVAWDAPGAGRSSDPPESFGMADYADCLDGFIDGLGLGRPHVAGLSFGGALALGLYRRHPATPLTLTLASAYAGWAGSLPADVAEQRLQQAYTLASLPPAEFVGALLPTMFSETTPRECVDEFGASMLAFHPAGFRAMARVRRELARGTAAGHDPDVVGIRRPGRAGTPDCRRGPPRGDLRFGARPSCLAPDIWAISKLLKRSTGQSGTFCTPGAADHRACSCPRLPRPAACRHCLPRACPARSSARCRM